MAGVHNMMLAGGASRVIASVTISANTNNYVLDNTVVPGYVAGSTDVTLTINTGVVVGSTTGAVAFYVSNAFNANDTVTIINNGSIVGRGGAGGSGGIATGWLCGMLGTAATVGSDGGSALQCLRPVSINNANGLIAGGGGGGGGGGVGFLYDAGCSVRSAAGGGGGGGGRGSSGGAAGAAGTGFTQNGAPLSAASPGDAGTFYEAGFGGSGGEAGVNIAGHGATGGSWGASGSTGGNGYGSGIGFGKAGGAGGACVIGDSNITWVSTGTRFGAFL